MSRILTICAKELFACSGRCGRTSGLQLLLGVCFGGDEQGGPMGCLESHRGGSRRRRGQRASVGAVVAGFTAAVGSAIVFAGGTQVANVPSAAASTTDATPWHPRPNTLPPFFPD